MIWSKNCWARDVRRAASVFLSAVAVLAAVSAAAEPQVFTSWRTFEPDKCASIWLIKRFINPEALIRLVAPGEPIAGGIPFDTPEAQFRRYHNASTFETLMRHYGLKDDRLIFIGKIIHDIEINTWERKRLKESKIVIERIHALIRESRSDEEVVTKSLVFFDELYALLAR
jgi:hypothetical protein